MIRINTIETWGFVGAIRGMRMPYESFDKSDSGWDSHCALNAGYQKCDSCPWENIECDLSYYDIGSNDMALAKKLIKGGPEHRKFLRMIHVQADVLAPRYWWAEMDKYKYVETNSSSTMHLITKKYLKIDNFSRDDSYSIPALDVYINALNQYIAEYEYEENKENKSALFRTIKQLLPESYNQLRTIDTNYECLLNIYHQRKNHRLSEWSGENGFCSWVLSLPYMEEFISATDQLANNQQITSK